MSPLCIGLVSSSFLPIAVLNLSLLSISPPSWLLLFPGFSALLPSIFSGVYESFWLTECRRNFWIFPKDFSPGLQSTLIPYWGSLLCYSLLTPFTSPISCKTFFSLALENIFKFIWRNMTFDLKNIESIYERIQYQVWCVAYKIIEQPCSALLCSQRSKEVCSRTTVGESSYSFLVCLCNCYSTSATQ